ncbi:hypothetical protein Scep_020799 [Stephania cephalantha]|uniref:Uncharacterized protein n=1 Tax=Stephania cephalantha TaxID=152367 RepID=A0AAP0IDS7_9MAGN
MAKRGSGARKRARREQWRIDRRAAAIGPATRGGWLELRAARTTAGRQRVAWDKTTRGVDRGGFRSARASAAACAVRRRSAASRSSGNAQQQQLLRGETMKRDKRFEIDSDGARARDATQRDGTRQRSATVAVVVDAPASSNAARNNMVAGRSLEAKKVLQRIRGREDVSGLLLVLRFAFFSVPSCACLSKLFLPVSKGKIFGSYCFN